MENDIRFDLAQFYPMKGVLENILGRSTYRKLKDYAELSDWEDALEKLLNAILLSINTTILIADDDWLQDVEKIVVSGKESLRQSKNSADLFASFSATLTKIVFLQIGFIPDRYSSEKVPLVPSNWKLDVFRSVQYIQSNNQKQSLKQYKERKKLR